MTLRILATVSALAIGLSGCAGIKSATPEQIGVLVDHLAAAGCKGTVTVDVGGEIGQLGGGFHAGNTFNGSCDPMNVPAPRAPVGGPVQ
jgi:hypothetical protein